jgi:hypothetical protein
MKGKIYLGVIPLLLLGIVASSEANVNSLTGGLDVGFDIDHRTNHGTGNSSYNTDYNRLVTTPSLNFKSNDVKYGIDFTYAPSFKYDLNGKGTDVDHRLNLSVKTMPVKEWQIKISELYIKADDSTQTANTESNIDPISNNLGRHRFWTNNASVGSDYTYLQDSVVSLGYTYSLLRNDGTSTAGFQDYDKHSGLLSVSYRFHPEWKATVGGQYVRGLYDTQQLATAGTQSDLSEYHGNMSLESYIFSKNILSVSYGYIGTVYDDKARNDSDIHNATLGWKRDVSPHLNFDLGGGPSYAKTEGQDAKWGYNAHAKLNYAIEHGKFGLGIDKAFGQDNFSGTSTGGVIDSWTVRGDFSYRFYEDLSGGVFASYADRDHQNALLSTGTASYQEKVYSTGLSMKYSFWRWYSATVGYTFSRQEADNNLVASYDDHRVYLTLGAQKELFRW